MKNKLLLLPIILGLCLFSFRIVAQPDTCRLGIFITNIYDIKFPDRSFTVDFWTWCKYRNDSLLFKNSIELPASKQTAMSYCKKEKINGIYWESFKYKAVIIKDWEPGNFPFDRQKLQIWLEEADAEASDLVYRADVRNSMVDPSLKLAEWRVSHFSIRDTIRTYSTSYGNPALSGTQSSYSAVVAVVTLERLGSLRIFIKLLTGTFVAFFLTLIAFIVHPRNAGPKLSLCVGALFTTVGNKYIIETRVPPSVHNTLIDNITNFTFFIVLVITGICVLAIYWYESGNPVWAKRATRLEIVSLFVILLVYLLINTLFIRTAILG